MNPVDWSRRRKLRPGVRRATLLLSAAVWLVLSGCDNNYALRQGDPFVGIRPANPGSPTPAATGSSGVAATQTASTGTTALPGTHTMTSPAALAGGNLPAPENPRGDLRMDVAPVVPASLPGGAAARGAAPSGVQVGGPEPVPETTSRIAPLAAAGGGGVQPVGAVTPGMPTPAASVSLSTPVSNMSFEEAQKYLKQRGVIWQRLETWGDQGQWKFQCSLPIPGSPHINRTYVTDPLPNDPLTAVRIVLDKIEKDQR
jgi:hypothetical protein